MESHSQSELSNVKKRRREEKPEPLPSVEQNSSKKKRRRKKKRKQEGTESHEHTQVLFAEPLVVATPIPITLEPPKEQGAEPIEATAVNPVPDQRTPRKSKRKRKKTKSVLTAPEPTPKESNSAEHPVPDPTPPRDTAEKWNHGNENKSVLESQAAQPEPKEPSNADHSQPQLCSVKRKRKRKKKKGAEPKEANAELPPVYPELPLDIAIPTDLEKSKKGAELNESNAELPPVCLSNAEYPQVCPEPSIDIAIPIDPENTKRRAEPSEPNAEHPPVCPEPPSDKAILIDPEENKKGTEPNAGLPLVFPEPPFDKAIPIDPEKNRKEAEANESNAEHPRVCPEPPLGLAISIDPEKNKGENLTPTDENELDRRNRRELVALVTSGEKIVNPRDHLVPLKSIPGFVMEQTQQGPVIPVCPEPASLVGQSQTIPVVDTEQKLNKKKKKWTGRRKNSMPDGKESVHHSSDQNTTELVALVTSSEKIVNPSDHLVPLKSIPGFVMEQTQQGPVIPICPEPASLVGQSQTIPVVDTEQEIDKKSKKWTRRSKNSMPDGKEPNEHNTKPPETKKSMLDGAEPNEHNAKLPETLMLASNCHLDQAIPSGQRRKQNKSERKSAGSESVHHSSHQNAKSPVQKAKSILDGEICFFCGKVGHSLKSCPVSRTGGGLRKFAKCLICHAQGHLSYNCTRDGRGLIQGQQ